MTDAERINELEERMVTDLVTQVRKRTQDLFEKMLFSDGKALIKERYAFDPDSFSKYASLTDEERTEYEELKRKEEHQNQALVRFLEKHNENND